MKTRRDLLARLTGLAAMMGLAKPRRGLDGPPAYRLFICDDGPECDRKWKTIRPTQSGTPGRTEYKITYVYDTRPIRELQRKLDAIAAAAEKTRADIARIG